MSKTNTGTTALERSVNHAMSEIQNKLQNHKMTLSSLQTNTYTFANMVDPDETAQEPSHLDLHCLPFC